MLVDDEESRRIVFQKVLDAAVVTGVTVRGIDLFHTFTDHAALLDRRRIVRQIKHRRIVVLVTDLYSAPYHMDHIMHKMIIT